MLPSSPLPATTGASAAADSSRSGCPTTPTGAGATDAKPPAPSSAGWPAILPDSEQQQEQESSDEPRRPRSIYESKERIPFWDAPLLVAVAANLVWPAVLMLLTGWSMLVVLCFRLERLLVRGLLRRAAAAKPEGEGEEDDAPVDVGLYFFGYGNHCEKWVDGEPQQRHRYFDPSKPSAIYVHGFARRTTARRFRETFNWAHNDPAYGLDVNAAGGWGCGVGGWIRSVDQLSVELAHHA